MAADGESCCTRTDERSKAHDAARKATKQNEQAETTTPPLKGRRRETEGKQACGHTDNQPRHEAIVVPPALERAGDHEPGERSMRTRPPKVNTQTLLQRLLSPHLFVFACEVADGKSCEVVVGEVGSGGGRRCFRSSKI